MGLIYIEHCIDCNHQGVADFKNTDKGFSYQCKKCEGSNFKPRQETEANKITCHECGHCYTFNDIGCGECFRILIEENSTGFTKIK